MRQANLPPEILALPIAERMELVAKIWNSIAEDAAIGLTDDQRKILDQRLADHQKYSDQGMSWEALKKNSATAQWNTNCLLRKGGKADITVSFQQYSKISPKLGEDFLQKLYDAFEQILSGPKCLTYQLFW